MKTLITNEINAMENYKYDDLCRLCATKTTIMPALNIFENEGLIRQISKKIDSCLPIKVYPSDELPKSICEYCVYKLDLLNEFRERSVRAERLLIELYREFTNVDHIQQTCSIPEDTQALTLTQNKYFTQQNLHSVCDMNLLTSLGQKEGIIVEHEIILAPKHLDSSSHSLENPERQQLMEGDHGIQFDDNLSFVQHHLLSTQVQLQETSHLQDESREHTALLNHMKNTSLLNMANFVDEDCASISNINYEKPNDMPDQISQNTSGETLIERISQEIDGNKEDDSSNQSLQLIEHFSLSDRQLYNLNMVNCDSAVILQNKQWFTCNICCKSYTDRSIFEAHYSTHVHRCDTCLDTFTSLEKLTNHKNEDHCDSNQQSKDKQWFTCDICCKSYADRSIFEAHYSTHVHKCDTCLATFTSLEKLTIHKDQDHSDNNQQSQMLDKILESKYELVRSEDSKKIESDEASDTIPIEETEVKTEAKQEPTGKKCSLKVCKECGKSYKTNYKLTEHMRKHTGEKPFKCGSCEKAFSSKMGLVQHEAKHTGKYYLSCPTCGKGFQCKSYLVVHQRVHSDVKPYPCSTCGQEFKSKQALLDHTNRHLGVKPHICKVCGKGFITKSLRVAHEKLHSGFDNRKYSCKICSKMFVSKSYLQTHLRIHTGDKPFKCEVCGKGFVTKVDLRIHSTVHTGEKSFVCEMCGKAFARRDALQCHLRSHTGERPYSCEICGQTFTQFTPMATHRRLHTGERPYVCETCGKTFVSRSTMLAHAKKHSRS